MRIALVKGNIKNKYFRLSVHKVRLCNSPIFKIAFTPPVSKNIV